MVEVGIQRNDDARATPHPGSLLSIRDLSLGEVSAVLQRGDALAAEAHRERVARLDGRKVALLFYESSTRTRTSFELAAKSLGAMTTLVSDKSSSIEKGESLHDTGLTLRALGAECIILRSNFSGAPEVLARSTGLPVLNAGDGMHEHPSQALLDLRTMLEWFGIAASGAKANGKLNDAAETGSPREAVDVSEDKPLSLGPDTLRGKVVVITGDIRHSRVARSNAMLLPRLGARVILCGPEELLPEEALQLAPGLEIERDFEQALALADVAMMLRVQRERLAGLELDVAGYVRDYQLHERRRREFAPAALVMHPGPMVRGLEITSDVADGPQSRIERQVTHGLEVRMALLCRALGCMS